MVYEIKRRSLVRFEDSDAVFEVAGQSLSADCGRVTLTLKPALPSVNELAKAYFEQRRLAKRAIDLGMTFQEWDLLSGPIKESYRFAMAWFVEVHKIAVRDE